MRKRFITIIAVLITIFSTASIFAQTTYTAGTPQETCSTNTCGIYTGNSTYNPNIRIVVSSISGSSVTFRIEKCSGTFTSSGTLKIFADNCSGTSIKSINISSGATGATFTNYTLTHTSGYVTYYGTYYNGTNYYYAGRVNITAKTSQPPTVITTNATIITTNSAKLNGIVNPNGSNTAYTFQYGTSISYQSNTNPINIGASSSSQSLNAAISGLSENSEYHYRIVASNSGGTNYGEDVTFYTLLQNFYLISPGNSNQPGTTINSLTPTFTWNSVNNASEYAILVTDLSNNTDVIKQNIGLNTSYTAFSGEFASNKSYKWQVGVNVGSNLVMSNVLYFNTNFPLPIVTTIDASLITTNSATMNGSVNPNGSNTSYYFQYGTTTSYGSNTAAVDISSGNSTQSVYATINSLQSNNTYHFRIVATNSFGTSYGDNKMFTTNKIQYTYFYSPALGVPTICGTGTMTLNTINYNCSSVAGTSSYTQGNVQIALISHNTNTGDMIFRFIKCDNKYYTKGSSGKLFIRQGPDVFCNNYTIDDDVTRYKDITINYSPLDFTDSRQFEAYLITSTQQTQLYAGTITITGLDPNNYITVTSPVNSSAWNVGNSYAITWSDNINEDIIITLAKGGMHISTISNSTPSNGSYLWMPPTDLATGNDYEIFIRSVNTSSIVGSSGYFSINGQEPYCSGTTILTETAGGFSDGSNLNNYINNSDCKWLIQPIDAQTIVLTFTSFSTELNNDIIKVYDGSTTSAPLIGTYSGSDIPYPIISSGGSLLVHFLTDGSTTSDGWTATYTSQASPSSLSLESSMGFETFDLITGTKYTFQASIKNNGIKNWTGCFFLKQGSTDWVKIGSTPIGAGQTTKISGTYTPDTPGNNLPLILNYQTDCGGGGSEVLSGIYSNPITVNVCNVVSQPALSYPGNGYTFSNLPDSITFQWIKNNSSGTATYRLKIRDITTDQTNGPIIINQNVGNISSYTTNISFTGGHTYRWVIFAESGCEQSDDSPAWTFSISSQPSQPFHYLVTGRDINGIALINQNLTYKISILKDSETGSAVYVETQNGKTNLTGLTDLEIGTGTVISGSFSNLSQDSGKYYIKIDIQSLGGVYSFTSPLCFSK